MAITFCNYKLLIIDNRKSILQVLSFYWSNITTGSEKQRVALLLRTQFYFFNALFQHASQDYKRKSDYLLFGTTQKRKQEITESTKFSARKCHLTVSMSDFYHSLKHAAPVRIMCATTLVYSSGPVKNEFVRKPTTVL